MRSRLLFVLLGVSSLCAILLGPTSRSEAPVDSGLPGIVFVGAPIFDEKTDGGDGVYQGSHHWRDGYIYPRGATFHRAERTSAVHRPGRNLHALAPARPDGKLTRLTHLKDGAVFRPEPSFDGKKVLFALRRDGEDWFHLCEVNVDGTGLRQLTDGPFNDHSGVYLPDGRIVFCSDRTGYIDEYHEERTETLFVMNGDGSGLRQITFLPGTYFEPSVLKDGRILFSFWDAFHIDVPPLDKHETFLMTVNPDGTEERHLFGAGQYRFFNRERHSGVGLTQARELPDGRILAQSEFGPTLLDLRAGLSARDVLAPVFPGTTSAQLGGTTHRVHLSPLGTRSTPFPLSDGRFLFSATPPGARDSGIWLADPDTRAERLVLDLPDHAEFDAVPVLIERPRPARLPERAKPEAAKEDVTRFLVIAGRASDDPDRASALKRARYFRVIEAEYTGVTTSSHTNLETRILGVVPIFPDGSAYFEAPADTPLFLDPLDAAGNRVLMTWGYENTSVAKGSHYPATQIAYMSGRAGETRSCYGCHAPQTDAVPNKPALALKYEPVKVTRESTDLQYRRNEPEAYRRQARIGEAAKYRPWLTSKDPVLRARACEILMHMDDRGERKLVRYNLGGGECVSEIAETPDKDARVVGQLLRDEVVEVRRAAALALTRLATPWEAPALEDALKDADWQVRFAAATALEALGLRPPPDGLQSSPFEALTRQEPTAKNRALVRAELQKPLPDIAAFRAAGRLKDPDAVALLKPWLAHHDYEYHAAEAALALGRIGTSEARVALLDALPREVQLRKVHNSRYLQQGPRPEEYALLKALLPLATYWSEDDIYLLLALLPNTFMEKPRFEDRMRAESQRVQLARLMLDWSAYRRKTVTLLVAALRGEHDKDDHRYQQILKGINLERPFSEHGRPFPVVEKIGVEEALWLLGCLLEPETDLQGRKPWLKRQELEDLVIPFLTSKHHRERIDAAVLLGLTGFGSKAADALAREIARPYAFPEMASIGKGMPDDNFRDKAYFVLALARHVEDVNKLKPFADPQRMTRDIRYGLTRGLSLRGKSDALPLLSEMATREPIALLRQQARYAIADIQDACRLRGEAVPDVRLPAAQPLEALYPPRPLTWTDTKWQEFDRQREALPADAVGLGRHLDSCLKPAHFRNLTNSQARGAERMMIAHVAEAAETLAAFGKLPGETGRKPLLAALDSPYPYVRHLAARALAERGEREAVPALVRIMEASGKAQDTVGFWWCCEALGQLQARDALPALTRLATATNPPGTFGPEGMAVGYPAARALARIAADVKHADVARLLASENAWLRAGTLRGLAEAKAPGVEPLLRQATQPENPAIVRQEALVQLRRRATEK